MATLALPVGSGEARGSGAGLYPQQWHCQGRLQPSSEMLEALKGGWVARTRALFLEELPVNFFCFTEEKDEKVGSNQSGAQPAIPPRPSKDLILTRCSESTKKKIT